jgi:hypothetical protein
MASQFDAWYVAKQSDGTWNFTYSTKLPVLAWDHDEHGLTGYVQSPTGDGATAAYLVPANDVHPSGSAGGPQSFLRYVAAS